MNNQPLTADQAVIGFIGLGVMGRPIASNLLAAGFRLRVYNRSSKAVEELVSEGAVACHSAADVADGSDAVITMLPDSAAVEDVLEGQAGAIEALQPGSVVIDMSTISPIVTRRLARALEGRGVAMLDAPVSGGEEGARAGTVSIMVGGPEDELRRCKPILAVVGGSVSYMGEVGAGQVTKACNQIVIGITIQAVAEALELAGLAGVDPARVRAALLSGAGRSDILERKAPRILDDRFEPGFKSQLHHKDLGIALETGRSVGAPLIATALVRELYGSLVSRGQGNLDNTALALLVRELGGRRA